MKSGVAVPAPLQSLLPHSLAEKHAAGDAPPEIRAYKLGKKRWSYNQVELRLSEPPGGPSRRTAAVAAAVHADGVRFAEEHQDSAVAFLIQLESGAKLQAHVYLCYDDPTPAAGAAGGSGRSCGSGAEGAQQYGWNLVTRAHCCKGCEGRVLRSIQRFGRLGKRAAGASEAKPAAEGDAAGSKRKDPRFMYLSFDEACTHVGAPAFRLVAGLYTRGGGRLLGTAVSPPIRVLANNDVPTGAATIALEATLPSDWEGWQGGEAAGGSGRTVAAAAAQQQQQQGGRPKRSGTPSSRRRLALKAAPASPSLALCQTPPAPRPLPLDIGTPSAAEAPCLLRCATAPQARVRDADGAQAGSGERVARQLSLPPHLPSLLPIPGACSGSGSSGDGYGGAASGGSWSLGPAATAPLAPPAAHAWPAGGITVPFGHAEPAAAQREAERQLFLLQQLKTQVAAMSQPAASCCDEAGDLSLQRAASCAATLQHQMLHSPSLLPANAGAACAAPALPQPAAALQLQPPHALLPPSALPGVDDFELLSLGSSTFASGTFASGGLPAGSGSELDALELESLHSLMVDTHADKMAVLEMSSLLGGDDDLVLLR